MLIKLEKQKLRDIIWRTTLDSWKIAYEQFKETDPTDEHYNDIYDNYIRLTEQVLDLWVEDRKMLFELIGKCVGAAALVFKVVMAFFVGALGMDWEMANTMTSKFAPKVFDMIFRNN